MKKLIEFVAAVLGLGALYCGWQSFRTDVPKPTDEGEFTRIDYLEGEYQKALEKRESELSRSRTRGKWFLGAGAAFLAGGVTLLTRAFLEEATKDESSDRDYSVKPPESSKSSVNNGDPVHETG